MLTLNDRKWKDYFIRDIFTVSSGKRLTKADMDIGNIPFIGATDSNNGITNWIATPNVSYDKNVLGVNYNGSVVENFYHPYGCVFSDDVKRLHLKHHPDNKYVLLFIKTVILQQKIKYTYGYKFNAHRIEKQKILLPINAEGEPDYAFMEQYIREREERLLSKYKTYIGNNWKTGGVIPLCETTAWRPFKVLDLFEYRRGNQNNMNALADGEDMLISAKNVNNGLKGFYCSTNKNKGLFPGNCITLNNDGDGGVGLAYYQPHPFLLDTHVYALYPKAEISSYAMLYISQALSKQRVCFSHGYSINQERLKSMQIMLPVDADGNPDYAFMERDIRERQKRKLNKYMAYIDRSRRA